MLTGPNSILTLKIAVDAVTVLLWPARNDGHSLGDTLCRNSAGKEGAGRLPVQSRPHPLPLYR